LLYMQKDGKLPASFKDHALKWDRLWERECHLFPDILLIYRIYQDKLELLMIDIGSHSSLF
jgi:mRNA interferase YafQ